jgi:hypothetical protein
VVDPPRFEIPNEDVVKNFGPESCVRERKFGGLKRRFSVPYDLKVRALFLAER